jgi:hypothetical protein
VVALIVPSGFFLLKASTAPWRMSSCGWPLRNQYEASPLLAWPGPELPHPLSASAPAVAAESPRKFRRERESCPSSTLVSVVQRPRSPARGRSVACTRSAHRLLEALSTPAIV